MSNDERVRMLTPPFHLWDQISQEQWHAMTQEEQDEVIFNHKPYETRKS